MCKSHLKFSMSKIKRHLSIVPLSKLFCVSFFYLNWWQIYPSRYSDQNLGIISECSFSSTTHTKWSRNAIFVMYQGSTTSMVTTLVWAWNRLTSCLNYNSLFLALMVSPYSPAIYSRYISQNDLFNITSDLSKPHFLSLSPLSRFTILLAVP